MILEEGVESVFKRHHVVGEAVRGALSALGLGLYPDKSVASDTLTAFNVPQGVNDSEARQIMADKYGIMISGGLQKASGKIMRIGHMGETARPHYVRSTILALESTLEEVGVKFEHGAGSRAADAILGQIEIAKEASPL